MQIVLDFDVKAEWLVSVIGIKIYKHNIDAYYKLSKILHCSN